MSDDNVRVTRVLDVAAVSSRGLVRDENQDVALVDGWASTGSQVALTRRAIALDRHVIVAVVDGMGGYAGGGTAAWMTARGLAYAGGSVTSADGARALVEATHLEIWNAGHGLGTPEMGAAFAALILRADGFDVFNVGDCRVYRRVDGVLGQLSVDDSGPSRLDPARTVLTQSVGGTEPFAVDVHWFSGGYGDGSQRFLLASDGLAFADHVELAGALALDDIEESASALAAATLTAGAPDNVTAIVVDVSGPRTASGES